MAASLARAAADATLGLGRTGQTGPLAVPPRAAAPARARDVSADLDQDALKTRGGATELLSSPDGGDLFAKVEDAAGVSLRDGHQLVCGSQDLKPALPLASYGISKGVAPKLVPLEPPPSPSGGAPGGDTLPNGSPSLASPLHELHDDWQRARAGLEEGHAPRLAAAGTGGCYFLLDASGHPVAVFKPADEEAFAANNPKGRAAPGAKHAAPASWLVTASPAVTAAAPAAPGEGLRRGLRPGEGAVHEVAAYVLDHGHFSGVPATALVQLELGAGPAAGVNAGAPAAGAKVGSLQQFVSAESDCEERGPADFPAREVHKIAVLDLRLANTDRNGGNILARRGAAGAWELVPIDHGCCLPDSFEDLSFEWAWWPQAEAPFDAATRAYIASLDADRDAAVLAAHGLALRPGCLRVLRVCTMLLKRAAAAGLNAGQIAGLASRQDSAAPSALEKMHAVAAALAASAAPDALDEPAYLGHMARLIDEAVDEFVLDNGGQLLL